MAKDDKFYFENFVASANYSNEAAHYLLNCLEDYDPQNIQQMMQEMHETEHRADLKKHEMNEMLAKAFVTPIEREDLNLLSQALDDVTDRLEEVLQKLFIYDIQVIEPAAVEFAAKIVTSCELLYALMNEFENFKKSKRIKELIIKINQIERECDTLYLLSIRKLIHNAKEDVLKLIAWREIFDGLEACADACEDASECVNAVIMKNS